MELTNFSLLFPDEKSKNDHLAGVNCPDVDMYTLNELGMLEILDLKSSDLADYFTFSPEVMKYRTEVFSDMMSCPVLAETLNFTKTAEQVFIPFTVGGGIRTVEDFREILKAGADKISVNSAAIRRPEWTDSGDKYSFRP